MSKIVQVRETTGGITRIRHAACVAGTCLAMLMGSTLLPMMGASTAYGANNSASAGSQSGSGQISLRLITMDPAEHGGTSDDAGNTDGTDSDDYGDNLAFTVPSAINYVLKANGELLGPSAGAAYIENKSVFPTYVSSLHIESKTPFTIVSSVASSSATNVVDITLGPSTDLLNAANFASKTAITNKSKWKMTATGTGNTSKVLLTTSGHAKNIATDVTTNSQFGTVHVYVTPGIPS